MCTSKMDLELMMPLDERIEEFKQDTEKMNELSIYIDDIIKCAQLEAEKKLQGKKHGQKKFGAGMAIITGFKRGRIVTRARSVFVRFFEVICNCTNGSTIPPTTSLETNTKT